MAKLEGLELEDQEFQHLLHLGGDIRVVVEGSIDQGSSVDGVRIAEHPGESAGSARDGALEVDLDLWVDLKGIVPGGVEPDVDFIVSEQSLHAGAHDLPSIGTGGGGAAVEGGDLGEGRFHEIRRSIRGIEAAALEDEIAQIHHKPLEICSRLASQRTQSIPAFDEDNIVGGESGRVVKEGDSGGDTGDRIVLKLQIIQEASHIIPATLHDHDIDVAADADLLGIAHQAGDHPVADGEISLRGEGA